MYRRVEYDECLMCQKNMITGISLFSFLLEDCICYQCRKSLKTKICRSTFEGVRLLSFYEYEDVKNILILFKDYLDVPIGEVFLKPYVPFLNYFFKRYTVLLIPSSESMRNRRGFNHLEEMLKGCTLPVVDCFLKEDEVQRFKKDRHVKMTLKEDVDLDYVILFDDVITSGNTFKAALELIRPRVKKVLLISVVNNYEKR